MPAPYQPPKPLWHFGWRGYCLLPILLALLWVAWSGYDLRYAIQKLVNATLPGDYVYSVTVQWLIMPGLMVLNPVTDRPVIPWLYPTAYSALPMLLALSIHPRFPASRWSIAVLAFVVAAVPCIYGWQIWLRNALAVDPSLPWSWTSWEFTVNPVTILSHLCLLLISLRIMREPQHPAYRILAGLLIAGALAWCLQWHGKIERVPPPIPTSSMWTFDGPLDLSLRLAWHLAWLALWLTWSIHARLHHIPPHACQHCAYDLRGLPDATPICPECGHSRPQATPESPAECPATATP